MITNHLSHANTTKFTIRPPFLPRLTEDDFCKGKYSQNSKWCYTARLLDIFLGDTYYVEAYKEFRLASMDYLYKHHKDDHASTGRERAKAFNAIAESLGYELIPSSEFYPDTSC